MRTYEIVETIRYTVEAESAEAALDLFVESDSPFGDFDGDIEDRTVYPED